MDSDIHFAEIEGLCLLSNWFAHNGGESYVIPFATTHPVNLVYHGAGKFDYGHYGIHLGQEDRLVFLGDKRKKVTAMFIDCRTNSNTFKSRFILEIEPSSKKMLCIPPGIAHTFEGLENINTINHYSLYLPKPEDWLEDNTRWDMDGDIINIATDILDDDIPKLTPNSCPASDLFYQIVSAQQRNALQNNHFMHAETESVDFDDGSSALISFREPSKAQQTQKMPQSTIAGLKWQQHLALQTGESSGIVPMLDPHAFYIVDHGSDKYTHDAYGIHLHQQDRLTFLGDENKKIILNLVDCRKGSSTLHTKESLEFSPSPLHYLIIPSGVAHSFEGLEDVYTINRPAVFSQDWQSYDSGNDVIDWPLDNENYPVLHVSTQEVPQEFYNNQVVVQKDLMSKPIEATPIVLMTKDRSGNEVKVSLRKRVAEPRAQA
jgi:dTDP-4-dehydrorhamnose 3,5-epimerase-like enzyme